MKFELNMEDLEKVTGGEGALGVNFLNRDYDAKELIDLYNSDPETGAAVIQLAISSYPDIVKAFVAECKANGYVIPDGMKALIADFL